MTTPKRTHTHTRTEMPRRTLALPHHPPLPQKKQNALSQGCNNTPTPCVLLRGTLAFAQRGGGRHPGYNQTNVARNLSRSCLHPQRVPRRTSISGRKRARRGLKRVCCAGSTASTGSPGNFRSHQRACILPLPPPTPPNSCLKAYSSEPKRNRCTLARTPRKMLCSVKSNAKKNTHTHT